MNFTDPFNLCAQTESYRHVKETFFESGHFECHVNIHFTHLSLVLYSKWRSGENE